MPVSGREGRGSETVRGGMGKTERPRERRGSGLLKGLSGPPLQVRSKGEGMTKEVKDKRKSMQGLSEMSRHRDNPTNHTGLLILVWHDVWSVAQLLQPAWRTSKRPRFLYDTCTVICFSFFLLFIRVQYPAFSGQLLLSADYADEIMRFVRELGALFAFCNHHWQRGDRP